MKGIVFNIQRFSINDGPGIRTTVFLKGCNNRCSWCHNPESLSIYPEMQFFSDRCIGCGRCLNSCPNGIQEFKENKRVFHRNKCETCGECAKACFSGAIEISGKSMSAEEVMNEILQDKVYYENSKGGVTISGGEPLLQKAFTKEILMLCKDSNIHTTIQTAGNYNLEALKELLPYTDLIMHDLKAFSDEIHMKYVGCKAGKIKENIKGLAEMAIDLIIRTPVIAGINDSTVEIQNIALMIKDFKRLLYYELIPYHKLGVSRYTHLGMDYIFNFEAPSKEKIEELAELAKKHLKNVIYNI